MTIREELARALVPDAFIEAFGAEFNAGQRLRQAMAFDQADAALEWFRAHLAKPETVERAVNASAAQSSSWLMIEKALSAILEDTP